MENQKTAGNDPVNVMPTEVQTGLTKREYFAAMAMQGMFADPHRGKVGAIISTAVIAADELIEELNK